MIIRVKAKCHFNSSILMPAYAGFFCYHSSLIWGMKGYLQYVKLTMGMRFVDKKYFFEY
jgi:hypothetical protein